MLLVVYTQAVETSIGQKCTQITTPCLPAGVETDVKLKLKRFLSDRLILDLSSFANRVFWMLFERRRVEFPNVYPFLLPRSKHLVCGGCGGTNPTPFFLHEPQRNERAIFG